jgi:hypothetical protein
LNGQDITDDRHDFGLRFGDRLELEFSNPFYKRSLLFGKPSNWVASEDIKRKVTLLIGRRVPKRAASFPVFKEFSRLDVYFN